MNINQAQSASIKLPLSWTVNDVKDKKSFCRSFTESHFRSIDSLLLQTRDIPISEIVLENILQDTIQELMKQTREQVQNGLGMVILQGCTLDRYSRDDFKRIFWMMGLFLGIPISQSVFGERIAHVRHDPNNPSNRTYRTTRELIHHTDTPDVLGLMCVRTAKSGGLSSVVSSLAIHNEIFVKRPDLLPVLYQGAPYARFNQQLPGQDPYSPYDVPVYCVQNEVVSCMYVRHMIEEGAKLSGKPLSESLHEAMNYFDKLATDPRFVLHFEFESGDIMFINNRTMLHSRTEYEDFNDSQLKRDLLRLWLDIPEGRRPVSLEMDPYQQPTSGGRGGVAYQPLKAGT